MGLWQTTARLPREVTEQLTSHQWVAAPVAAGMGESGLWVDAAGEPLFPVMTWGDRRTALGSACWRERVAGEGICRITGLPQDHICSAHKLLWHGDQHPAGLACSRSFLCLANRVICGLTGQASTGHDSIGAAPAAPVVAGQVSPLRVVLWLPYGLRSLLPAGGIVSGSVASWLMRTLAGEERPAAPSSLLAEAAAAFYRARLRVA